jgi:hypothetical protein
MPSIEMFYVSMTGARSEAIFGNAALRFGAKTMQFNALGVGSLQACGRFAYRETAARVLSQALGRREIPAAAVLELRFGQAGLAHWTATVTLPSCSVSKL